MPFKFNKDNINSKIQNLIPIVLIIIFILIILSALFLPGISRIKFTTNKNEILIEKAYLNLEKIIDDMLADNINYPDKTISIKNKIYKRGFNYTVGSNNDSYNKFCYLFVNKLHPISGAPTDCPSLSKTYPNISPTFETKDGMFWNIFIPIADNKNLEQGYDETTSSVSFPINPNFYTTKIIVDVNGIEGPNCSRDKGGDANTDYNKVETYSIGCLNPDQFIIGVRYDGKLQIGCTSYYKESCKTPTDINAISILSKYINK